MNTDKWIRAGDQSSRLPENRDYIQLVRPRNQPNEKLFVMKRERSHKAGALKTEVDVLSVLDHPNIVKLVDYDLGASPPWIVTKYCEGGTLQHTDYGRWTINEKVYFVGRLRSAFEYMYKAGFNRLDMTLDNIFLAADCTTPVLGDFESAKRMPAYWDYSNNLEDWTRWFSDLIGLPEKHRRVSNPP